MAEENGGGIALALGWLSIGLGLSAVAAPGSVVRLIGVRDDAPHREVLIAVGLREIAAGVGLLTSRTPTGWVWARAAGDMMDLSLLGAALMRDDADRDRLAVTTAVIAGITAVDVIAAQTQGRLEQQRQQQTAGSATASRLGTGNTASNVGGGKREVRHTVTIDRSPEELYRFWRDFENLPRFMDHLESVQTEVDGLRSHWRAKAPAGARVEWDAEVLEDVPNERIAWRSLPGAGIQNAGVVRFVPAAGGRGTEVHVELRYSPPGGALGAAVAKLFGEEPDVQVKEDLRRFKQVMETGEVVVSDGTINRADRLLFSGERPAQPPTEQQVTVRGGTR